MSEKYLGYRCSICKREYSPNELTYTCPHDGGNLDVVLDYPAIRQQVDSRQIVQADEASLWRYLPLLPVSDPGGYGTPLRAGWGNTGILSRII